MFVASDMAGWGGGGEGMVVRGTSQRSVRTTECHYGGALDDHAQVAVQLRVNFDFIAQL